MPSTSAGKQTPALYKNSKCSEPLSHLPAALPHIYFYSCSNIVHATPNYYINTKSCKVYTDFTSKINNRQILTCFKHLHVINIYLPKKKPPSNKCKRLYVITLLPKPGIKHTKVVNKEETSIHTQACVK